MRRALLTATVLLLAAAPSAEAAARLDTGIFDPLFADARPEVRGTWLDRTVAQKGSLVRILLYWNEVAPRRPVNASAPDDPAYRWAKYDAAVRDATARGLRVLLSIIVAPTWAEQAGRPPGVQAGSW